MKVPVKSITRECQLLYDTAYGRVGCSNLAYNYHYDFNGNRAFRCSQHAGMMSDTDVGPYFYFTYISEGTTFGLGYKP